MNPNSLNKQFNIPAWVKGNTPAKEAESIKRKFKDRTDKTSIETMEELLKAVANKQEYLKMQQSLANESLQVPDRMNGEIPSGMEQFAKGGFFNISNSTIGQAFGKDATGEQQMNGIGAGIQGLATAADLGNMAFGDTGIDTSGQTSYRGVKANQGGMALSGALKGASAGMALGPVGAAVGGVLGGVAGLIGGGKKRKELEQANVNNAFVNNAQYSKMAFGGYTNSYSDGGHASIEKDRFLKPVNSLNSYDAIGADGSFLTRQPLDLKPMGAIGQDGNEMRQFVQPVNTLTPNKYQSASFNSLPDLATQPINKQRSNLDLSPVTNWLGKNAGNIMQYAPIIGNLTDKVERAKDPRRDRLDKRYRPDIVDEAQLQKIVENEYGNISNALRNTTNGSVGALRSNLLAASLNKNKALSNAYLQADDINRQENRTKQLFDLEVDQINLNQSNLDETDKQMNEAAYQTAKSAKRAALFEDLGKIGKEEVDKKLVKEMFGYTWDGRYFRDKKGKIITNSDGTPLKQSDLAGKITPDNNTKMFGGYLKRK